MAAHTIFKSGGHMTTGIGSMARIGRGGAYAGRVVGLVPALKAVGAVGGIAAEAAIRSRQAHKDYNDKPVPFNVGTQQGQTVQGP